MKNILMVCVGNICRSPMAEGLLKKYSDEKKINLHVSSAGLSAMLGYSADLFAVDVMRHRGIDISQHQPRQVTQEILSAVDLILVMEAWQQKEIGCLFPSVYGKVHKLGKWANFDVPDPYRKSFEHFESTCALIEKGLLAWEERLWR